MRIRTIKPSFFKNEVIADLDPLTRLLFVGLWCMADGLGRLEDRPKRIRAEVLPYDECDVDTMLDRLAGAGFISRYVVDGNRYIEVEGFRKHQRINGKEADYESEIPGPSRVASNHLAGSDGEAIGKQRGSDREPSTAQEGKGKERKGREGTREHSPLPEYIPDEAPQRLTAADITADPESRWRYEQQTAWARALKPVLGSKLGAKLWPQYKRLVDRYGLNLVDAVAQDCTPDDRWPEGLETRLMASKADLDRKHASAPDADPHLDRCRGIIAEHGWEECLGIVGIRNVPDEATLLEALSGNRALVRKLIARFDPDADKAQQGAA